MMQTEMELDLMLVHAQESKQSLNCLKLVKLLLGEDPHLQTEDTTYTLPPAGDDLFKNVIIS